MQFTKAFFKINEIFKDFVQINCIINFSTNKMAASKNKKRAMHCGWQCSFKACLIALKKEFDAHKNVRCPVSEEIKNHFKRMIERDENEQSSEMDPPPTKEYNLRSHVINME